MLVLEEEANLGDDTPERRCLICSSRLEEEANLGDDTPCRL